MLADQQFENFVLAPPGVRFEGGRPLADRGVHRRSWSGAGRRRDRRLTALPVTAAAEGDHPVPFRDRLDRIEGAPVPGRPSPRRRPRTAPSKAPGMRPAPIQTLRHETRGRQVVRTSALPSASGSLGAPPMPRLTDQLRGLFDLEVIEDGLFRGGSPPRPEPQRVFGGQVLGQALFAAARTVAPTAAVHSLHAYFLPPGDPAVPIAHDVEPLRDGRSFTSRRVAARQHGRKIFDLTASFHAPEAGPEHQDLVPEVPAPRGCPTLAEAMAESRGRAAAEAMARSSRRLEVRHSVGARASEPGEHRRPPTPRDSAGWHGARRAPARRPRPAPLSARVHERPDPAPREPRPRHGDRRRTRTTSSSPHSTTRCGSTGRSGRTSGCSTTRCRPTRTAGAPAACRSAACSTRRECSWRRPCGGAGPRGPITDPQAEQSAR